MTDLEIIQLVKEEVRKAVTDHRHTGTDSLALRLSTFFAQQPAISAPSGSGTAGVDNSARTAINTIISTLKTLKLTK